VDPTALEPVSNRIYLYDLNNNRPIVDYFNDGSVEQMKNGKIVLECL
jgi:hypothetical protein